MDASGTNLTYENYQKFFFVPNVENESFLMTFYS